MPLRPAAPDVDDLVAKLQAALASREDVVFAYLFGSRGAGSTHPRADVDVGVFLRGPTGADPAEWPKLALTNLLTSALRRDDVDVVLLNDASPALAFEALRGKLILSRDEGTRIEAEARIMSRYYDRLPYLKRSLDAAMGRIRERGLG